MATYTSKTDVENLLNVDDLSTDQINLAIDFGENRVDDEMPGADADAKKEAATYMAAHVAKLMLRTGSTVVSDGNLEIEQIEDGDTMYSSMFSRVASEHGTTLYGRVG